MICCLTTAGLAQAEASGTLTPDLIKKYAERFDQQSDTQLRINAITNNAIKDLSLDRARIVGHNSRFNHTLESSGITAQKSTGRCWMFAALNVVTPKVMADLKMDEFELSQSYLAFYDKLEKANRFLEDIILYRDSAIHSRTVQSVLESPFGDGGWWGYFTALIEKYGAVPKAAMPETKQSSKTGRINSLTSTLLRGDAAELRQMAADGKSVDKLRDRKEDMLADVYEMLVYAYGPPPTEFDFRYEFKPDDDDDDDDDSEDGDAKNDDEDDDEKPYDVIEHYTPRSFYDKYVAAHMRSTISISHNPTVAYDEVYRMEGGTNVQGAPELTVLNLSIERLKYYTLKSLLDSQIVWFACDVGKDNYGDSGVFMPGIYDYGLTFQKDFSMTKPDRIFYHDISPNHAMVIRGADTTDSGVAAKWLVENSWGKDPGNDGEWTMYDPWFDEYVLMVIIDESLLDPDDAAKMKKDPIVVPYWEPFYLALRQL
jgi:bleomycin hydrolase